MPYSILSVINRSLLATPFEVFLNQKFIHLIRFNNINSVKLLLKKGFNPNGYWDPAPDIVWYRQRRAERIRFYRSYCRINANPKECLDDLKRMITAHLGEYKEPTAPWNIFIPFHEAVREGRYKIIELLLEAGADPNILDSSGRTALFQTKDKEMIQYLLRLGLDLEHKNARGHTYLHSESSTSRRVLKMMIELGANVNSCDSKGYTVLMSTVMYPKHRLEKIEYLRRAGVDATAVSKYGWNAFHAMIDDYREKHYENMYLTVRLLKRMGVDINQRTNSGYTALAKASFEGSYYEMKAFLENGADPNIGFARNGKSETTMLDELPNYWCPDKYKKIEMLKQFGAK